MPFSTRSNNIIDPNTLFSSLSLLLFVQRYRLLDAELIPLFCGWSESMRVWVFRALSSKWIAYLWHWIDDAKNVKWNRRCVTRNETLSHTHTPSKSQTSHETNEKLIEDINAIRKICFRRESLRLCHCKCHWQTNIGPRTIRMRQKNVLQ